MSKVIDRVEKGVKTASALYAALGIKAELNDTHGDVESVKALWFIPLFRRNKQGQAHVLGIRARRLDR